MCYKVSYMTARVTKFNYINFYFVVVNACNLVCICKLEHEQLDAIKLNFHYSKIMIN